MLQEQLLLNAKAAGSMVVKGAVGLVVKVPVGGVKKLARRLSTTGRADVRYKKSRRNRKENSRRERLD